MKTPGRETLILFDIDGTLIRTAHAGLRGMGVAFSRLHQRPQALDGISFAGRTDRAIVSDALRAIGVEPSDTEVLRLRDEYLEHLPAQMALEAPPTGCVLPGVHALLETLAQRPGVHVGLLTGNFERGAALKLGHFGLWEAFGFGAFGDHHLNRRDLVPLARERARRAGIAAADEAEIVIIGDTPLDVDCAHAHGARAIAVATGMYDRAALTATGADVVVESLEALRVEHL